MNHDESPSYNGTVVIPPGTPKALEHESFDALLGVWAVADDVAGGYGGVPPPRVFEHRFEGGEVAMYVGDDEEPHFSDPK